MQECIFTLQMRRGRHLGLPILRCQSCIEYSCVLRAFRVEYLCQGDIQSSLFILTFGLRTLNCGEKWNNAIIACEKLRQCCERTALADREIYDCRI